MSTVQQTVPKKIVINIVNPAEEIRMDQVPKRAKWNLVPLYKPSASGSLLMWEIAFDGANLLMKHGYVDGIVRTDTTAVKTNTTGRSLGEQALLEARNRYKIKYMEGYLPGGSNDPRLVTAMKGNKYKEGSIRSWPVAVQPKLNGVRMVSSCAGTEVTMRSWLNNRYTHLIDIESQVKSFLPYLPPNCTLDGEMYNHDMDFTRLISAVKTVKSVHRDLSMVQYWIFDIDYTDPEGTPFEKRSVLLSNAFDRFVEDCGMPSLLRIVPTDVCINHSSLMTFHDEYVSQGYEGIMIKKTSNGADTSSKQYREALYKSGKGNNILKYKVFTDEEATVVGVTEAEGTEKGAAILLVLDRRGNQFPVRMRGPFETRKLWFQKPDMVMGKEVTIRYQELSVYGVPRFPVGVAIRDYE